ncbi:MAG: hypothetical protein NTZ80_01015 [Patescibacteria group bacterium]|nr:hypothetical protein [Patescibacteria group bacterium]
MSVKNCIKCNEQFEVSDQDRAFYDRVSPVFNQQKYLIPEPTMCPDCRRQRRLSFRNERNLYYRNCDLCKKKILTFFSPTGPIKRVYCGDCYNGDKWDPEAYGRDFDFNKPFFEQFAEILYEVPKKNLNILLNENSEYNNQIWHCKNCYYCFDVGYGEECLYDKASHFVKNVIDCSYCKESELIYECIECKNCYNSIFSEKCENCSNCAFCFDCKSCSNCILCSNLRQAEYYVRNQKVSKEEFKRMRDELFKGENAILEKYKLDFADVKSRTIYRENYNIASENCLGENILNSKDCQYCFDTFRSQDLKWCHDVDNDAKDCRDCSHLAEAELVYDCAIVAGYRNIFSLACWASNLAYSAYSLVATNTEHLFGCSDIHGKEFCILNKKYSKKEFEDLVEKIIKHMINSKEWGEFFPASISPFAYNETIANEHFPLSKEQVLNSGLRWIDKEDKVSEVKKVISKNEILPIIHVTDEILDCAIKCEKTGRLFKLQKMELDFYRKIGLPIPYLHPDVRYERRMKLHPLRKLWHRVCGRDGCKNEFETTFSPERSETVYCEKCYNEVVYG